MIFCIQVYAGKHVVFGKVIRGYEEVVERIAKVPVDEKDRPLSPVVISNCGELELRKPPGALPRIFLDNCFNTIITLAKSVQNPESNFEEREAVGRRSRRSASRSRSRGPTSERERRTQKKSKRKRGAEDENQDENQAVKLPVEETEEEYDARLEREEMERIEVDRKRELERIKRKYNSDIQNSNGIRFKGQ